MNRQNLKAVVGVGASAGGLEALNELVEAIPERSGIAFVIVQHLSPDHPSIMDELLSSHTSLPVKKIEDGMSIQPDTIFVIPSGPALEVESGAFKFIPRDNQTGVRTPIDIFLTSLSEEFGELACCVILSGTGTDGTMGLKAVKSAGGIAIVQEATSARFSGMPDSAAATGVVDARLKPMDVPANLISLINHRDEIRNGNRKDDLYQSIERRLDSVIDLLANEDGQDFSNYKPGTLVRRIERRMILQMKEDIESYYELLASNQEERTHLLQDFLIGVTRFFRDPNAFDALTELAIEPLLKRDQDKFRVWVPGCSTGEEAYSIGILFAEAMRKADDRRELQIFGTDIDMNALRQARSATYSEAALHGVPEELIDRYFLTSQGNLQVDFRLRERVAFAPHNLLRDPPFSRIDFISCRNLLIYLNAEGQSSVMPRFHYALNKSGFLFLGPSETVDGKGNYFSAVSRDHRLYRRNDAASVGFSALSSRSTPRDMMPKRHIDTTQDYGFGSSRPPQDFEGQVDQFFLTRHSPPFLVVSADDEVRYLSGTLTPFIRHAKGIPSAKIEDLLSPEIRSAIRPLINSVRETAASDTEIAPFAREDAPQLLRITVEILPFSEGDVLVVLQPVEVAEDVNDLEERVSKLGSVEAAEQELSLVRRRLATAEAGHAVAEQELRSANEELLSMNEELQSSNEELETSREELQSINEELETINAELSENNKQLNEANSDLKNVLEATDIAKLILAKGLIVRRFTRTARDILSIDDRDVGRKVTDLKWHVDYPELSEDIAKVEATLQVIERELYNPSTASCYEVRVRPYRGIDDRLDGCIITFVDITRRKDAERNLRESREQLSAALEAGELGVYDYNLQTGELAWDKRMRELWGVPPNYQPEYEAVMQQLHPEDRDTIQAQVEAALNPENDGFFHAEYRVMQGDGSITWVRGDGQVKFDGDTPLRMVGLVKDVTREHEAEMRMREYTARLELTYEVTGIGAWEWKVDGDTSSWTPNMFDLLGCERDVQPSLDTFLGFVLESDRERVMHEVQTALHSEDVLDTQFRIMRGDGEERILVAKGRVIRDSSDQPEVMIGINYDVTEDVQKDERRVLLTNELNHRVKNSLATIQSIASQTLRHSEDMKAFKTSFLGRLHAIAMAHDLLINGGEKEASIRELIASQVLPYAPSSEGDRVRLQGPPVVVGASVAHGLGLVLHELATNASKYGALSTESGHVEIRWEKVNLKGDPGIRFVWQEAGGPEVSPPTRKGFGSLLIQESMSFNNAGATEIDYEAGGVRVTIEFPLRSGDDD